MGDQSPAGKRGQHILDERPELVMEGDLGQAGVHGLLQSFEQQGADLARIEHGTVKKGFFHPPRADQMEAAHPEHCPLLENALEHDRPRQGEDQLQVQIRGHLALQAHSKPYRARIRRQHPAAAQFAIDHPHPHRIAHRDPEHPQQVLGPPAGEHRLVTGDLARFKQQQVHGPVAVYSRSSFSSKRRVAK